MSFKSLIPLWLKSVLRNLFFLVITPFNVLWYFLFHRKFFGQVNQRALWEGRQQTDFEEIKKIEQDPYYRKFDEQIQGKLTALNSQSYLEVGCYCGYRLNKFATRLLTKKFIGAELGFENLVFGQKQIIRSFNISLVNANVCQLPFKSNSIETVYTVVCLTHVDYASIKRALDEMIRVCAKNLLLVEVDMRPMALKKKIDVLNWNYGYMHFYEKLVGEQMKHIAIQPLYDLADHPRYTMFEFRK